MSEILYHYYIDHSRLHPLFISNLPFKNLETYFPSIYLLFNYQYTCLMIVNSYSMGNNITNQRVIIMYGMFIFTVPDSTHFQNNPGEQQFFSLPRRKTISYVCNIITLFLHKLFLTKLHRLRVHPLFYKILQVLTNSMSYTHQLIHHSV